MNRFGKSLRSSSEKKLITPGPSEYQLIDLSNNREQKEREFCTFGGKTMRISHSTNAVGPGSYDPCIMPSNSPEISIGKAKRIGIAKKLYTAQIYDVPDIFGAPKIGFTMDKKVEEFKKGRFPGPGSYNIPSSVGEIPSYLIKAEPES